MAESNPFTLVQTQLWSLVEAFPPWADSVRMGNRIKFTGNARDPEKENRRTADTPEVSLFPSGGTTNLHSNSSQSEITKEYVFTAVTGDKRVNWTHDDLHFYMLQAISRWKSTGGLSSLVWKGATFVEDANVSTITEGITDEQLNKNLAGWASTITIVVRMRFAQVLFREP